MLFHSSIRKELARSFGATLVVLVTVVTTMTLIRTLGDASRGTFNPSDVMIIMGYTVLSDMPTILAMSLFIAMLSTLTRMYRDSEMVIWFGGGKGLASLLAPLLRFAWPIVLMVFALAIFILPWAFGRIEDLRDKFEKRGDIARVEPGQFQESANGDRVFFIEKETAGLRQGSNVFIATHERDKETVTSARTGSVETIGQTRFLILKSGQRLESALGRSSMSVSTFETYGSAVGSEDTTARSYLPSSAIDTWSLINDPTAPNLAELSWRCGLILATLNFVVIGLASAGVNPRVGRTANLGVAFLTFVLYFNLLVLGKSWVASGKLSFGVCLIGLHGGALLAGGLWLAKRHNNWALRLPQARSKGLQTDQASP
jgi:lipopolysaccharide export system permease protein